MFIFALPLRTDRIWSSPILLYNVSRRQSYQEGEAGHTSIRCWS